jgi:hypothetical protein
MNVRGNLPATLFLTLLVPAVFAGDVEHQAAFFEAKVRPLLVARCYECHSTEAGKSKGGLLLDSRDALRKGGESGPVLDLEHPELSPLLVAVRRENADTAMPPKEPLARAEVAVLEEWIRSGAFDPRSGGVALDPMEKRLEEARAHWAFLPLHKKQGPEVRPSRWVRTPLDAFVLAGFEKLGLQPAPEADPRTVLKRLSLDITGLLPDAETVEAFARNPDEAAYERAVDALLASPHFGERWGRHWLDLARYADSSGLHNDLDRPHAWRYRDYVIASFNTDKPYARFIAEQLAGDEFAPGSEEALVATGFCRNGPSNEDNMGNKAEQYRLDELDDVISTTASVFLGLSLGCARCHDHKYDPLTAADYYQMLAVFNGTEKLGLPQRAEKKSTDASGEAVKVHALIEKSSTVRPTYLLKRGNLLTPGAEVSPGPPKVLDFARFTLESPGADCTTSGRRLALSRWIASPQNPLTWRVLANRLWQYATGRPIVATPSNFGFRGERPSNPALLDYLAGMLLENGGRMKPVLREIFLSATYRQSSAVVERSAAADPDNRLFWRMPRRRMQAEILRDNILRVSGCLNAELGGPGIKPRIRPELIATSQRNKWPELAADGPGQWRRSVYIYAKRQLLLPMMELFDAPASAESCALRSESVVPTQALLLMNDEFVEEQAFFFAQRAWRECGAGRESLAAVVSRMLEAVLLRPAGVIRLSQATRFVEERAEVYTQRGEGREAAHTKALADLGHVLFNTSEFLYVD